MNFQQSIRSFFHNYTNFSDRSSRSEYWFTTLFLFLCGLGLAFMLGIVGSAGGEKAGAIMIIPGIFYLAIIIPSLALSFRRLHDIGKSGWWILISFVPFIGGIIFIVFCLLPSDGPNQWGQAPLQGASV